MNLFDGLFSYAALEQILSGESRLRAMLTFEAALATAEARAGIIPEGRAREIAQHCDTLHLDISDLAPQVALAGNAAIPLIKALTDAASRDHKDAARFVHWGATSQDAIDTGFVLQVRDVFDLISAELARLTDSLVALADQHRATPVVARTWMQHAAPTTFGFIVAGWLDAILRHRFRLAEIRPRILSLQFGGAVGTLASLRDAGPRVAAELASELQLSLPDISWHSHRDRVAELATFLAMLTGSLGKIARDISLHSQTEIAEISEPSAEGRGTSSTMPHKRNPVTSAVVLAAAARLPGLTSTILSAMPQDYERGLGGWHAEWETMRDILRLSAGALHHLASMFPGLQVHPDRMSQNIDASRGLIFAEAVTFALADRMGKLPAHLLVEAAAKKAANSHRHLKDVLLEEPGIHGHLTAADLAGLFDVRGSIGTAAEYIQNVLSRAREFPARA